MDKEEFEKLITDAFQNLPKIFRKKIENLTLEVAEGVMYQDGTLILGRYQGVPLTSRTSWYGNVLPDKIIIYKGSIERITQDPGQIKRIVGEVLRHEFGHYFGLDEEDLKN